MNKKAKIAIGVGVGVLVVGGIGSALEDTPQEESPTPTASASSEPEPTESQEPAGEAKWKSGIVSARIVNPATVQTVFWVKNVGDAPGKASCLVEISDPSGTYEGFDVVTTQTLKPGVRILQGVPLTVTNEGAAFVTDGDVTCD